LIRLVPAATFLKQHKVQVVAEWPANSPDLNPIENLWSWVQRQVNKTPVSNVAELQAAVFKAWSQIPSSLLQKYAASMEKRLQKVRAGEGAYTGY
jgi:transposase